MDKTQVAETLVSIGTLLELKGENPFKTRAYANAARAMEAMSEPLEKVVAEARLGEVKGIGEGLQKKIAELVTTGRLGYYEELKASTPPGLVAMLDIPGLGPKKVKALHEELGLETVEAFEQACKDGKVAGLTGFGEKTAANILEGIHRRRVYASRICWPRHCLKPRRCLKSCARIRTLFVAPWREASADTAKWWEMLTCWHRPKPRRGCWRISCGRPRY